MLEEILKAFPCAENKGLVCHCPGKNWFPCCRLIRAIKKEGQPIRVYELKNNKLHITQFKRPNGVGFNAELVEIFEPLL